jgi:hypothetical protein
MTLERCSHTAQFCQHSPESVKLKGAGWHTLAIQFCWHPPKKVQPKGTANDQLIQ